MKRFNRNYMFFSSSFLTACSSHTNMHQDKRGLPAHKCCGNLAGLLLTAILLVASSSGCSLHDADQTAGETPPILHEQNQGDTPTKQRGETAGCENRQNALDRQDIWLPVYWEFDAREVLELQLQDVPEEIREQVTPKLPHGLVVRLVSWRRTLDGVCQIKNITPEIMLLIDGRPTEGDAFGYTVNVSRFFMLGGPNRNNPSQQIHFVGAQVSKVSERAFLGFDFEVGFGNFSLGQAEIKINCDTGTPLPRRDSVDRSERKPVPSERLER